MATGGKVQGRQTRLDEHRGGGMPDPPLVIVDRNADTVHAPRSREDDTGGKVAGYIGPIKNRDGMAYVSRKVRTKHRYRKGGGYALSKKILHYLMNRAHHLVWYEAERNRTLEFSIRQYVEDSERVKHAPAGDPQVYVPDTEARHIWPDHTGLLDAR